MKLRIKGNSIRLRLLRSEVERFANDGRISDEINFGENSLRYTLLTSDTGTAHANIETGEITVAVPKDLANQWTTTDQVGIEAEQRLNGDDTLSILIEKDFACVGRPDDPDHADAFPAP